MSWFQSKQATRFVFLKKWRNIRVLFSMDYIEGYCLCVLFRVSSSTLQNTRLGGKVGSRSNLLILHFDWSTDSWGSFATEHIKPISQWVATKANLKSSCNQKGKVFYTLLKWYFFFSLSVQKSIGLPFPS